MRTPIPIFDSRVPAPALARRPGLVLAQPRGRCGRVAWLHARLTLPRAKLTDVQPSWLRNLHVTAITRTDQIVQIASLWHTSVLARALPWQPHGDGVYASLSFCFDLGAAVDHPLHAEPLYVHLSCDELCSEVVVLGTEALPLPVVEEPIRLDDPFARLLDAYTLARLDRTIEAVALFEAVLDRDRALRTDVDACHLYNAACVLSRAGVQRGALRWLREDSLRRVQAHTAAELADYATAPAGSHEAALREHFDHVEHDVDLELLGEHRRVAALLESHR